MNWLKLKENTVKIGELIVDSAKEVVNGIEAEIDAHKPKTFDEKLADLLEEAKNNPNMTAEEAPKKAMDYKKQQEEIQETVEELKAKVQDGYESMKDKVTNVWNSEELEDFKKFVDSAIKSEKVEELKKALKVEERVEQISKVSVKFTEKLKTRVKNIIDAATEPID